MGLDGTTNFKSDADRCFSTTPGLGISIPIDSADSIRDVNEGIDASMIF